MEVSCGKLIDNICLS